MSVARLDPNPRARSYVHTSPAVGYTDPTGATREQAVTNYQPPIARGTSCPGHVLVPWAHSPIWSRQDPIFVSLIQIASYKR